MSDPLRPPEALFIYAPPWGDYDLDSEVGKAVGDINASGWVWTAESCSGHEDPPWHDPFVRFVVRRDRTGELLWLIQLAWDEVSVNMKPYYTILPAPEGTEEWAVMIVRISPVFGTDRSTALWMLNDIGHRILDRK